MRNYPIQNSMGWSETLSDIAAEADYTGRLNYKDAASGYMGFRGGRFTTEKCDIILRVRRKGIII